MLQLWFLFLSLGIWWFCLFGTVGPVWEYPEAWWSSHPCWLMCWSIRVAGRRSNRWKMCLWCTQMQSVLCLLLLRRPGLEMSFGNKWKCRGCTSCLWWPWRIWNLLCTSIRVGRKCPWGLWSNSGLRSLLSQYPIATSFNLNDWSAKTILNMSLYRITLPRFPSRDSQSNPIIQSWISRKSSLESTSE